MRAEFSTIGLPVKQRGAVWREMCRDTFGALDCESDHEVSLGGQIIRHIVGDFTVVQTASTEQKVQRTASHVRSDVGDFVIAHIQLEGTSIGEQDGRVAHLTPGEIAIYETRRPFSLNFSNAFRQVVLLMPRTYMAAHFGNLHQLTATPIARKDGVAPLAYEYLARLPAVLTGMEEPSSHRMTTIAFEFLAASLAEQAGEVVSQASNSILAVARAKRFVNERLHDPALNVPKIARAVGLSTRRLQDLFQEQGTTVTDWMSERRLSLAQRQLLTAAFDRVTIGTIAASCGFADQAHFSRRFKERYGISPRDARASRSK